jgi:hypothetical protein
MDPDLYLEVLRKQAQVWEDLMAAFEDTWTRWAKLPWTPENSISLEDVLADLAYGRD